MFQKYRLSLILMSLQWVPEPKRLEIQKTTCIELEELEDLEPRVLQSQFMIEMKTKYILIRLPLILEWVLKLLHLQLPNN